MALPISNFTYSKAGFTVNFTDLSMNNPISWVWDFGTGATPTTSTSKNPSVVYTTGGFYIVKLTVTNAEGVSEPLELSIGISDVNTSIGDYSIWFLSEQQVPDALRAQIDNNEKRSMISNWQKYLYPLIPDNYIKPLNVVDVHNELLYDSLVNDLIAKLIAYEFILEAANQNVSTSATGPTTVTGSRTGDGDVKSIETGPAKVEFYQDSTSDNTTAAAAAVSAATRAGGSLDQLKTLICQLSKRLRIYLPMCGQLAHGPIIPSKVVHPCTTALPIEPTNIVSEG